MIIFTVFEFIFLSMLFFLLAKIKVLSFSSSHTPFERKNNNKRNKKVHYWHYCVVVSIYACASVQAWNKFEKCIIFNHVSVFFPIFKIYIFQYCLETFLELKTQTPHYHRSPDFSIHVNEKKSSCARKKNVVLENCFLLLGKQKTRCLQSSKISRNGG